ncbi:ATP synthase subunit I [Acidobacteriota bacterium]
MTRNEPLFELADNAEEKILRRVPLETLICTVIAAIAGLFLFNYLIAILVFAGGLFAMLNFYWLKQTISNTLTADKEKSVRKALPLYIVRIMLILAIFFIIIIFFSTKILAFVVGFSMIIPVFLIEAAGELAKLKQWKN